MLDKRESRYCELIFDPMENPSRKLVCFTGAWTSLLSSVYRKCDQNSGDRKSMQEFRWKCTKHLQYEMRRFCLIQNRGLRKITHLNGIVDYSQICCNAAPEEQIKCGRLHPENQSDKSLPVW